ncbi:DinB family protein [Haloferula sp.]|uniref:DinB family protein n=1 Tax=Haloferula sp. TaxID=2497595 RepID=UPI003C71217D
MSAITEPQLAAPGAGLPAPELFVARKLFALKCRVGRRDSLLEGFREERARIRALLDSCPAEKRGTPVLIPRRRGMEDSSRNWSVWMTLDHLRIVNDGVGEFIAELSQERTPDVIIGTADVKPDPGVTGAIEASFEQGCDDFLARISRAGELKSKARCPHPWFGPMDAFQWLALASMHMGIHRGQIAAIIRGLNP